MVLGARASGSINTDARTVKDASCMVAPLRSADYTGNLVCRVYVSENTTQLTRER